MVSPSPTPSPTPTPSAVPVVIFANPATQEYASVGVSTPDAGGYTPVTQDARLVNISLASADQARIRYTAAGVYEIQLPGANFDKIVHYKGLVNPSPDNTFFQPASVRQNYATFGISSSRKSGYTYSELGSWTTEEPGRVGFVAFGTPTPASNIPTIGNATFNGVASGFIDTTSFDNLYGGYYFDSISGQITLNVDFASSALFGNLALNSDKHGNLGIYSLAPMNLASGTNAFSGSFNSTNPGFNEFRGVFTGSSAQEAIGAWALPVLVQGTLQQTMGAWIARRGN
jgi:hypothetical protein